MKLRLPLKNIHITQPFGTNFNDFYENLGMIGHNGIDFRARNGCPCFAAHNGIVVFAGTDSGGGNLVEILASRSGDSYKTVYYHLKDITVKRDELVKGGELIGHCDNTGIYTTGDHLHFGLKLTNNEQTLNKDNGFNGGINPAPYFFKDWDKSNAFNRYGKSQNWMAEFLLKFHPDTIKNQWVDSGRWIRRQLLKRQLKPLDKEQVNAIIYGSWDFETIINTSMREIWLYCTKAEWQAGYKPFN